MVLVSLSTSVWRHLFFLNKRQKTCTVWNIESVCVWSQYSPPRSRWGGRRHPVRWRVTVRGRSVGIYLVSCRLEPKFRRLDLTDLTLFLWHNPRFSSFHFTSWFKATMCNFQLNFASTFLQKLDAFLVLTRLWDVTAGGFNDVYPGHNRPPRSCLLWFQVLGGEGNNRDWWGSTSQHLLATPCKHWLLPSC